jgi:hypothetical protein
MSSLVTFSGIKMIYLHKITGMIYNRYKLKDIKIGDKIYFDDVYVENKLRQPNYDEFWKVHEITDTAILVTLHETHFCSVDIKQVREHLSAKKGK